MKTEVFQEKIEHLPPEFQQEVMDFVDFLLDKCKQKPAKKSKIGKFKFDWEGGLADLKDKYTSVELQHKALEWR